MNNDDDFDIIDNTLNITVDVDDDREDEMEEEENNNKKNNTKLNQSIVGYAKTINLNIDLNKAFNWYKENYIGKFDLENNEPPEITSNGDYTTTDTNDNNYQEINNYVPPTLNRSTEPNTKKTRSLYSNYFKVNVSPPTISSPITYNGYYKFDGNALIPGTDQDYNIYVNIPHYTININNIYQKMSNGSYSKINLNYTQNPINDVTNYDLYFYLKNFVDHVELCVLAEYGIDINQNIPGDCYYATGGYIGQYQAMILDLYVLENGNYRILINYNLGTGGSNSTGATVAYYYNTQLITA